MATAVPEMPVLARDLAFERLYRRYVKDVYHYALAMLRNPADAEDITQTTFLNAYRAMQRGEEPLKPHNWLIKIAHNAARTRYARSTRRVSEVPLDDHIDVLAVADDEKPDLREVLDALGRLPLNQRGALVMRELEGRSYADIAEALGVSVPAVETLIFRARRSLKLKASAVRVVGVVQVPPSLAQLFDGGTVIAGGGAAIGSGVLLKAAVALVAGVVATGVTGGEGSRRAEAAAVTEPIAAPPWAGTGAFARAGGLTAAGRTLRRTAVAYGDAAGPGIASHRKHATGETNAVVITTGGVAVGPSTPGTPSPQVLPTASVPPLPGAPKPVQEALPPVSVPTLPPVSVPTLPLPEAPAPPSIPTVSLPSPPPLPPLP